MVYPWLKSRGPIETLVKAVPCVMSSTYPWLKSRGPIETCLTIPMSNKGTAIHDRKVGDLLE